MVKRPSPWLWTWYAVGGRLSHVHHEWVLHDLTCHTWVLRHIARSTVLVGPLAAIWWALPAPVGLHLALSLLSLIVGYFYSCAYMVESAELRLVKHGYPPGTFKAARAEATREADELARARYLAIYGS